MGSSCERKEVLQVKNLFFMMDLGCIFEKIIVTFVAESYTIVSQNIQIYFDALQLDVRFDAAAKPERM